MAKNSGRTNAVEDLKVRVTRSRERVERDFRSLRYEMDIPRKIRRSFHEQPALWLGAIAAVGTLLVVLPMRRKKIYVDAKGSVVGHGQGKILKAGFALGALRLAAELLRPVVIKFVASKMQDFGSHTARKW